MDKKMKPSTQSRTLVQHLGHGILGLFGWKFKMVAPPGPKYLIIGAPHTSNWDFILMLLIIMAGQVPIRWMGKDNIFRPPFGWFFRALGGIPVNRRERTNLVAQVAAKFDEVDSLIVGIAPEGTRKKTTYWKTGFYYIALTAKIPIVMGYIDGGRKICGLGPSFMPSGDIQADFEMIRAFYKDIKGITPSKQSEIEISPETLQRQETLESNVS